MCEQYTDDEGVIAITFLQSIAGIKETPESALKEWRGLTPREKGSTMHAFHLLGCVKETKA